MDGLSPKHNCSSNQSSRSYVSLPKIYSGVAKKPLCCVLLKEHSFLSLFRCSNFLVAIDSPAPSVFRNYCCANIDDPSQKQPIASLGDTSFCDRNVMGAQLNQLFVIWYQQYETTMVLECRLGYQYDVVPPWLSDLGLPDPRKQVFELGLRQKFANWSTNS